MSILDFLRTESFYQYVYPLGGLILGIITLAIFVLRKDLRKIIILMSVVFLPFAPIVEYLFFKDYWFPPDFLDFSIAGLRFISGDIIMIITTPPLFVVTIPFLFNLRIANLDRINYKSLAIKTFLAQCLITAIYFFLWYTTGLNSIYCYILACIALSIVALLAIKNKQFLLLYPLSILGMGVATFLFYLLYQLLVGDYYLRAVWLLDHSKNAINVANTLIPLTEVLFGAFVAPFYFS